MSGDFDPTAIDDAYLDKLNEEQLLALYCQCDHAIKVLKTAYSKDVSPQKKAYTGNRSRLMTFMAKHNIECVELSAEDGTPWYLRLLNRTTKGETLSSKLIADVLSNMTPEHFRQEVQELEAERQEMLAKWRVAQEKEARKVLRARALAVRKRIRELKAATKRKASKRSRLPARAAQAKRLAEEASGVHVDGPEGDGDAITADAAQAELAALKVPDPKDPAQVNAMIGAPEEPQVRWTGPRKAYAQRALPAFHRPLRTHEVLSHVVYRLIAKRHKVKTQVLAEDKTAGKSVVTPALETNREFVSAASQFWKEKRAVAGLGKDNQQRRRALKKLLDKTHDRVNDYVTKLDPSTKRTKRTMGDMKVTVISETKPGTTKELNLFDVSGIVDDSVKALGKRLKGMDAPFSADVVPHLLREDVSSALLVEMLQRTAALETSRVVEREKLKVLRHKPGEKSDGPAGEGDTDDESGSESDDNSDLGVF